jgi:hypothetical protein
MKERETVASDLQRSGYKQRLTPGGAAEQNGRTGCLKGDHQYVALRRQGVGHWANNPVPEKNHYYESRKKKKNGTD